MLYKHGDNRAVSPAPGTVPEAKVPETKEKPVSVAPAPVAPLQIEKDTSPAALRELLEKNLKWSQIIYEQNRKIKNALVWKAVVSWFWFIALVVLPTLASVYVYQNREAFMNKFSAEINKNIAGMLSPSLGGSNPAASQEQILKLLPLDQAQKEQLKTMLNGQNIKSN